MKLDIRNPIDEPKALRARAYLNDVLVPACVMADEGEGCIEHYKVDAEGRIIADEQEQPILMRAYGRVRIELQQTRAEAWQAIIG